MELGYLHEHPLILSRQTNNDEELVCSGCSDDILPGTGPIFFCSQQCKFVLHKSCTLFPKKITHFLHTRHPLALYAENPYESGNVSCTNCRQEINGFVYHCSICGFDLDIKCAQLLPKLQDQCHKRVNFRSRGHLEAKEELEMELQHPFHEHLLNLSDQIDNAEQQFCDGCIGPVLSTPFYVCSQQQCKFVLHKTCSKIPIEITHHSHPKHRLTLMQKHPLTPQYSNCDSCGDPIRGFLYHCSVCGHNLDITCASIESRQFGRKDHNHTFIELWPTPFTCDFCGVRSEGKSLLCITCQVRPHQSCASLPHVVKINCHDHRLKLRFGLHREERCCAICSREVNTNYGFYYCRHCKYIVDLECGTSELYRRDQLDADNSITKSGNGDDELDKLANGNEVENDLKRLHSHGLILCKDEQLELPRKCKRCMSLISTPFYRCIKNCGYFYHESCAKLPNRIIYHPLHEKHPLNEIHPLIFRGGKERERGVFFTCDACELLSNGSCYCCEECGFELDVECGLRSDVVDIEKAHQHPLRLVREARNCKRKCRGCGWGCGGIKYRCSGCDYNLCLQCVGLPNSAKHQWDEHPLELAYESIEHEYGEYYCDQCEEPRDPNQWFYHCEICDRDVHPKCMRLHNVDLEKTYRLKKYHPQHTVTIGANPQVYPICSECGFPCKGLYFQCIDCKYYLHWSLRECGPCPPE